jgi:hypothetical protein
LPGFSCTPSPCDTVLRRNQPPACNRGNVSDRRFISSYLAAASSTNDDVSKQKPNIWKLFWHDIRLPLVDSAISKRGARRHVVIFIIGRVSSVMHCETHTTALSRDCRPTQGACRDIKEYRIAYYARLCCQSAACRKCNALERRSNSAGALPAHATLPRKKPATSRALHGNVVV